MGNWYKRSFSHWLIILCMEIVNFPQQICLTSFRRTPSLNKHCELRIPRTGLERFWMPARTKPSVRVEMKLMFKVKNQINQSKRVGVAVVLSSLRSQLMVWKWLQSTRLKGRKMMIRSSCLNLWKENRHLVLKGWPFSILININFCSYYYLFCVDIFHKVKDWWIVVGSWHSEKNYWWWLQTLGPKSKVCSAWLDDSASPSNSAASCETVGYDGHLI